MTFQCISEHSDVPSWHEFKDSVALLIGISHSQTFTNRTFHFLIIAGSAVSHVFAKYVPALVLRSHSSLMC